MTPTSVIVLCSFAMGFMSGMVAYVHMLREILHTHDISLADNRIVYVYHPPTLEEDTPQCYN